MIRSVAALAFLITAIPAAADVASVANFGASPTATAAANATAFQSAINALPSPRGGIVEIPAGNYELGTGLFWNNKPVILRGAGTGVQPGAGTRLVFPATVNYGVTVQNGPAGLGAFSRIEDLVLVGAAMDVVDSSDGIRVQAHGAQVRNVVVRGFGGSGIRIASGNPPRVEINANGVQLYQVVAIGNHQHGLLVEGSDSNAGLFLGVDARGNRGWGIFENGFLGNTYVAPHVAGNGAGGYRIGNISRNNIFVGAYAETDKTTGLQMDAGGRGGNVFVGTAMANPVVDATTGQPNIVLINGRVRLGRPSSSTTRQWACVQPDGWLVASSTPCTP